MEPFVAVDATTCVLGGGLAPAPSKRSRAADGKAAGEYEVLLAKMEELKVQAQKDEEEKERLRAAVAAKDKELEAAVAAKDEELEAKGRELAEAEARAPKPLCDRANPIDHAVATVVSPDGTESGDPAMQLYDRTVDCTLPRFDFSDKMGKLKHFFVLCSTLLTAATCPPEDAAADTADDMAREFVSTPRADGATAWAEPALIKRGLWTSYIAALTNWRPFRHGMVRTAAEVGPRSVPGLNLGCMGSYMAPGRMSYTGNLVFARLFEAAGGAVLLNALCLDLLFLCACLRHREPPGPSDASPRSPALALTGVPHADAAHCCCRCCCCCPSPADLVAAGDTTRGTGDSEPDMELNGEIMQRCADFVFPLLFYSARLVLIVDSDMCKAALFRWFQRQAADGFRFGGVALSDTTMTSWTGMSSAHFYHTTTLGAWLVFVPTRGTWESHFVLIIFGYSSCFLCREAKKFVAQMNHYQMQLVRGLALLPTRHWSVGVPLFCAVTPKYTRWLTQQLGVLVLTPSEWSPYLVCETWQDYFLLASIVTAVKAAGARGSLERVQALFRLCANLPTWIPSVRSLIGSHEGGKWSPYDVCETWAQVLELSAIVRTVVAGGGNESLIQQHAPSVWVDSVRSLVRLSLGAVQAQQHRYQAAPSATLVSFKEQIQASATMSFKDKIAAARAKANNLPESQRRNGKTLVRDLALISAVEAAGVWPTSNAIFKSVEGFKDTAAARSRFVNTLLP